jgi:hypothetical protein
LGYDKDIQSRVSKRTEWDSEGIPEYEIPNQSLGQHPRPHCPELAVPPSKVRVPMVNAPDRIELSFPRPTEGQRKKTAANEVRREVESTGEDKLRLNVLNE